MGSTAIGYAILVLVAGSFVGWNARRAYSAHSDLKVHKARIPGFRRVRMRSGLTSIVVVVLVLLALRALMK